ncbi:MAG: metallophosphoesterase [Comamonadaceae bacterium]|nr:metallophosphoesterase [Comamonadaceae bacterium]
MGAFSILFVATLLRELALLLLRWQDVAEPERASAQAVLALAAALSLLALASARRTPRVKRVRIAIDGIASRRSTASRSSRSATCTSARRSSAAWVEDVVARANALDADLVALTGDLVDGRVKDLAADLAPLGGLRARHGVFAVTGNHEYYSGVQPWIAEWERLGFQVLVDAHRVVHHGGACIVVGGVADYAAARIEPTHRSDPGRAIAGAPASASLRLLLAHQPRSAQAAAAAGFDVQLSGHTHGGQIWPGRHLVPLQQPFAAGLHRVGRLVVYVSRGTGYWGPPMRLGAPSEITRIVLVPAR